MSKEELTTDDYRLQHLVVDEMVKRYNTVSRSSFEKVIFNTNKTDLIKIARDLNLMPSTLITLEEQNKYWGPVGATGPYEAVGATGPRISVPLSGDLSGDMNSSLFVASGADNLNSDYNKIYFSGDDINPISQTDQVEKIKEELINLTDEIDARLEKSASKEPPLEKDQGLLFAPTPTSKNENPLYSLADYQNELVKIGAFSIAPLFTNWNASDFSELKWRLINLRSKFNPWDRTEILKTITAFILNKDKEKQALLEVKSKPKPGSFSRPGLVEKLNFSSLDDTVAELNRIGISYNKNQFHNWSDRNIALLNNALKIYKRYQFATYFNRIQSILHRINTYKLFQLPPNLLKDRKDILNYLADQNIVDIDEKIFNQWSETDLTYLKYILHTDDLLKNSSRFWNYIRETDAKILATKHKIELRKLHQKNSADDAKKTIEEAEDKIYDENVEKLFGEQEVPTFDYKLHKRKLLIDDIITLLFSKNIAPTGSYHLFLNLLNGWSDIYLQSFYRFAPKYIDLNDIKNLIVAYCNDTINKSPDGRVCPYKITNFDNWLKANFSVKEAEETSRPIIPKINRSTIPSINSEATDFYDELDKVYNKKYNKEIINSEATDFYDELDKAYSKQYNKEDEEEKFKKISENIINMFPSPLTEVVPHSAFLNNELEGFKQLRPFEWDEVLSDIPDVPQPGRNGSSMPYKLRPELDEPPLQKETKFIKEAKAAGVRIAATQLNKLTTGIISIALPGDQATNLHQFLESELGSSLVSMINGAALTYGLANNEMAQTLAKEFRISSLTTAGNFAFDELIDLVGGVTSKVLEENSLQKDDQENLENLLIEDIEKELKNEQV